MSDEDLTSDDDDEPGVPGLVEPAVPGLYPILGSKKPIYKQQRSQPPPWKKPAKSQISTALSLSPPASTRTVVSPKPVPFPVPSLRTADPVERKGRVSDGTVSITGDGEVRMVAMDMVGDSLVSSHSLSSRIKNSFIRIQDVVGFMETEASIKKQNLVYETLEETDELVRLNLILGDGNEAIGEGSCFFEAKENGCRALWSQSDNFLGDEIYSTKVREIQAALPPGIRWTPAFDSRHVHVEGEHKPFYETEIFLGPLSVTAAHRDLSQSLASCCRHLVAYLVTRDRQTMFEEPGKRLEVGPRPRYVTGNNIIDVKTECHRRDDLPPPVDLVLVQPHLPMGVFPPGYGGRDKRGWVRIFFCHVCHVKIASPDILEQHVTSRRHTVRLGRVMVNDMLKETFNPCKAPHLSATITERLSINRYCKACDDKDDSVPAVAMCRDCSQDLCDSCREEHHNNTLTKYHELELIKEEAVRNCQICEEDNIEILATSKCEACQKFFCRDCELEHKNNINNESHSLTKVNHRNIPEGFPAVQEKLIMEYIGDIIGRMNMCGPHPPWAWGPRPVFGGRGRGRARANYFHPYPR